MADIGQVYRRPDLPPGPFQNNVVVVRVDRVVQWFLSIDNGTWRWNLSRDLPESRLEGMSEI